MAGLENYLSSLKDNAGIAGGFNQGIRDRVGLDTTLAGLEQKKAELQRYTGETPSFLRKSEAGARTAELANVQSDADVAAGVPDAKAQESLMTARQKAAEAKKVLDGMDAKTKLEMMDQMSQKVEKFNQLGLQLLQFSGSTGEAIQRMAEAYPDITKDTQFTQWAKQYGNMPREQALNAFKFEMQKYASGISTTREKFQTEALQEDQKQQGRMELGQQTGQFGMAEAQTRTAATGANESNSEAISRLYGIANDTSLSAEQRNAAIRELNYRQKLGQTQISQRDSGMGLPPQVQSRTVEGIPEIKTPLTREQIKAGYKEYTDFVAKARAQGRQDLVDAATQRAIEAGFAVPRK